MTAKSDARIITLNGGEGDETGRDGDLRQHLRMAEAIVFASSAPVSEALLAERLPQGVHVGDLMRQLQQAYSARGVNLVRIGGAWAFRTSEDLRYLLQSEAKEQKKLSRAALEVLATIAYHQPVTRAEIEDIRGVATAKGTLDILLEAGWVKMRGRRRTAGRPVTYGTTLEFLDHFGLAELRDLPGLEELKGSGLLQSQIPASFEVPQPFDEDGPGPDEDPLSEADIEELGLFAPRGGD